MPGEWAPHKRCWILWPFRGDRWREDVGPARKAITEIIKAIAQFEPVVVGVAASVPNALSSAKTLLSDQENVSMEMIESDSSWVRDTGPTFLVNHQTGELGGVHWKFNTWGRKALKDGCSTSSESCDKDNLVGSRILSISKATCYHADMVLEGGSIHTDGEGTLLTTEECLLNPNRNPHLSKTEIEMHLKSYLNVKTIIWLPRGLTTDEETNGHVDNLACFAGPGRVLLCWCDDTSDPEYEISREAFEVISKSRDAKGRELAITKIPIPPKMEYTQSEVDGLLHVKGVPVRKAGDRLPASYVNFYMANGGIVCPGFDNPETNREAFRILQETFPDRKVVMVPCREVLIGGGNIHCITQQEPIP